MPRNKLSKKNQSTTDERSNAKIDECDRETVIMFVDIMGSSEVSNHKKLRDYSEFVRSFQALFTGICKKYTDDWYEEKDRKNIRYSVQ
jgi:class 3 adenylate cyclase